MKRKRREGIAKKMKHWLATILNLRVCFAPSRLRVSALLILFIAIGCSPKTSPPPIKGHVVLIRGFQDWYSTGIDELGKELHAAGCDATVFPQSESKAVGESLATSAERPLVLIGFSYGADDVITIARKLAKSDKTVDLLITIDPVTPSRVPANVRLCVNYYQSNGLADAFPWLRGVPLKTDDPLTPLDNFDLRKNRTDLLQSDTSHATIAGHKKLHEEIVWRTVGVVSPAGTLWNSTAPAP